MANLIIQKNGAVRTDPAIHGEEITIQAPCDCSTVTGVQIAGESFPFYDAHGNTVGNVNLFAKNALVKVILDTELKRAYVQNADTNAYLEGKFQELREYVDTGIITPEFISYDGEYEAEFDALLEAIFLEMPVYSTKQIRIYAPNITSDTNYVGTLFKAGNTKYGVLRCHSYSNVRGCLLVKLRYGDDGWFPFEWENPSMIPDEEYRTTERFNYKPVYAKTFAVKNASGMGAEGWTDGGLGAPVLTIVRQNVVFYGDNIQRPLSVSEAYAYTNGTKGMVFAYDLPEGYNGTIYFQVWYTKE